MKLLKTLLIAASVVIIVVGRRRPRWISVPGRRPRLRRNQSPPKTARPTLRRRRLPPPHRRVHPAGRCRRPMASRRLSRIRRSRSTALRSSIRPPCCRATRQQPPAEPDLTGSINRKIPAPAVTADPAVDALPASFGPALRAAAAAGDPAPNTRSRPATPKAAALRATGRRGALARARRQRGLRARPVPARRLHEKGEGVKKDIKAARQLYLAAADKGHAKAMHNLAVLYAEGIDGKPDYRTASQWFRKAAALRRHRQPVQSRHPLCPRHRRRAEPGGILQMVRAGRRQGRPATPPRSATRWRRGSTSRRWWRRSSRSRPSPLEREPEEATNLKAPPGGWDRTAPRLAGQAAAPDPDVRRACQAPRPDELLRRAAASTSQLNKRRGVRCYILRGHPRNRAYTERVRVAAVGVT